MKTFGCFLISALAIIALVPTSGQDVEPLYERKFNFFDLLTSPQAILSRLTSLTSRFAILQSTVDILSSQFTALQTLVKSLQDQITALQQKSCPIPGGTIYSGKCYTVKTVTTGIKWADAQLSCLPGGGALAEPSPTAAATQALYTALRTNNAAAFATIEVTAPRQLWIGYKTQSATDTNVVAQIAGTSVDYVTPADPIIVNPKAAPAATGFAAAINAPVGNTWSVLAPAITGATAPKAYICQYNLV